jgi:hypothetical protein
MSDGDSFIDIEPMSVDQAAGAFVMVAGAIGSLLLVIWQSKCHCKVNLCYIFSCERRPPNEEEMKSLKDQAKELKDKAKEKAREKEVLQEVVVETPRLIPKTSKEIVMELEPEPESERPLFSKNGP